MPPATRSLRHKESIIAIHRQQSQTGGEKFSQRLRLARHATVINRPAAVQIENGRHYNIALPELSAFTLKFVERQNTEGIVTRYCASNALKLNFYGCFKILMQRIGKRIQADRLIQMIVHAGIDAAMVVLTGSMRR